MALKEMTVKVPSDFTEQETQALNVIFSEIILLMAQMQIKLKEENYNDLTKVKDMFVKAVGGSN